MPNLLPFVFIGLGASALGLALLWLWRSLRVAFVHVDQAPSAGVAAGSQARASLITEKQAVLLALKDLEAERDGGKLSEGDFAELNARYRTRAREVLKALDAQLAPHRASARALLREATQPAAVASEPASSAVASPQPIAEEAATPKPVAAATTPAAAASTQPRVCAVCASANPPDAAECKQCGNPLTETAS